MSALIPKDGNMEPRAEATTAALQTPPTRRRWSTVPADSEKGSVIRFVLSFAVAAAADGLNVLFPPVWVLVDAVTAVLLLGLWGLRWEIALALALELIPGLNLCPTWVAFVLYMVCQRHGPKPAAGGRGPAAVHPIPSEK